MYFFCVDSQAAIRIVRYLMKRQFPLPFLTVLLCVLAAFLLGPKHRTSAQTEEDPDFIITLALMAVADDRLDGVMSQQL